MPPKPLLIGLAGRAGSGKSTVANYLVDHHLYIENSFAHELRWEVQDAIDNPGYRPLESESLIMAAGNLTDPWEKPTSPAMRRLLQWWGTEYRRTQDPHYWLKALRLPRGELVVISDVRFNNEAYFLRHLGGIIWRIEGREDLSVPMHASETEIGAIVPHQTIWNNGTLEDLRLRIDYALGMGKVAAL